MTCKNCECEKCSTKEWWNKEGVEYFAPSTGEWRVDPAYRHNKLIHQYATSTGYAIVKTAIDYYLVRRTK